MSGHQVQAQTREAAGTHLGRPLAQLHCLSEQASNRNRWSDRSSQKLRIRTAMITVEKRLRRSGARFSETNGRIILYAQYRQGHRGKADREPNR
jgi:hypothetical protein